MKGQRLYLEEINWRGGSQFFELFFPIRATEDQAQSTREGGDVNTKHKSNNLKSTRQNNRRCQAKTIKSSRI